jgi:hypothetical protein
VSRAIGEVGEVLVSPAQNHLDDVSVLEGGMRDLCQNEQIEWTIFVCRQIVAVSHESTYRQRDYVFYPYPLGWIGNTRRVVSRFILTPKQVGHDLH